MKKKKKVSIQDIADKLGVSKGTVSLVLSGKAEGSRISDEMSKKVKETAEEMNYQPNEIARSLSTGKTMTIGVIVTDISNEFFGNLTFHIQEQAKKYGYTVITTNTNESLDEFSNAVTTLLNKQVDGIIFVPVDNGRQIAENEKQQGYYINWTLDQKKNLISSLIELKYMDLSDDAKTLTSDILGSML